MKIVNVILFFTFEPKDNLAYKKPTWQTLDKYSSDKAVEGLYTNLSAIGNQCAVSFASSEVTWLVDLETINSISKIVLYHVTEGSTFGKLISLL